MNGILIINKNLGYTSRDVVNIVGKFLGTRKIGHTGTLDPMASGVLVLCVGNALKMCELLTNHDKEYIAGVTLGIETDTLDLEGNVLRDEFVNVSDEKIKEVLHSFIGSYNQEVPKYSAVKINGKKLYEYARNGIDIKLPSRMVDISSLELISDIERKDGKISFKIKCEVSKGTYIRSLVRDIGYRLESCAVMNSLVRTRQGNFTINDAFSLDDIENGNYKFISITEAFPEIPVIKVSDDIAFKVKNGVVLDKLFESDMAFICDINNNLLALYKNDNGKCKAYKMFV